MRRKSGQQLSELAVIGAVVVGVAILSLSTFGNNIASIFDKNTGKNLFASTSRTASTVAGTTITTTQITINGEKVYSPVDSVLLAKLSSNSVQTSGSSGAIETGRVMKEFSNQFTEIINNIITKYGSNSDVLALLDANTKYNEASTTLISTDGTTFEGLAQQMNATTDVTGSNAQLLLDKAEAVTTSGALPLSETEKKAIELYANSLVSLGASLDYSVDSRFANDIDMFDILDTSDTVVEEFNNLNNWTRGTNGNAWTTSGGKLINNDPGSRSQLFLKSIPETQNDYSVELNKADLSRASDRGYGVYFRSTGSGSTLDGYCLQYDPGMEHYSTNGRGFVIRKINNGNEDNLYNPFASFYPSTLRPNDPNYAYFLSFDWAAPHDLKLEVVGNKYTVYIDGRKIMEVNDAHPIQTSGTVGLKAWDGDGLSIDSLKVSKIQTTTATNVNHVKGLLNELVTSQEAFDKALTKLLRKKNITNPSNSELELAKANLKKDIAKYVHVYMEGTYSSILPDAYNGDAMCKNIGNCTIN